MLAGTYTAMITPFGQDGSVDSDGLERLVSYQKENGADGLLIAGTTGETPSLSHEEYEHLLLGFLDACGSGVKTIASCGKNNFHEALQSSKLASELGYDSVLLVDPYYNGPSSMEIRKEYVQPIAESLPGMKFVPYVIPGRTGTQLLPQDLAILHLELPNVDTVKEATGNLANMKLTRKLCGTDFSIMSGDDALTFEMMTDGEITANGVISVMSNIFPKHVSEMVRAVAGGDRERAERVALSLAPWFDAVTIKVEVEGQYGRTVQRFRNPLAVKTAMSLLGMPSGGCRRPIGRLHRTALDRLLSLISDTLESHPELLEPVEEMFGTDLHSRLGDRELHRSLCYASD